MPQTTPTTPGQRLTAELRTRFVVSTRTHWNQRNSGVRLTRSALLDRIEVSVTLPGYDTEATTECLRAGWTAAQAWRKHVDGGRVSPMLAYRLTQLTPWHWTAYLGRMADSGATNMGEFERWLSTESHRLATEDWEGREPTTRRTLVH